MQYIPPEEQHPKMDLFLHKHMEACYKHVCSYEETQIYMHARTHIHPILELDIMVKAHKTVLSTHEV